MILTLPSRRRSERGNILIVTMCTMMVVGLALLTYLQLGKNQNQLVMRSQVWNHALPVAEAGLEDALSHATYNVSNWLSSGWLLSSSNTLYRSNVLSAQAGWYNVVIATNTMVSNYVVITSTGYHPTPGGEVMVPRTIRVHALVIPAYRFALYGKTGIDFNGNGIRIDSYDSRNPAKSTGGLYDAAKAGDQANVGTYNGTPAATYDVGNGNIWGKVIMGPKGTVKCGPNGAAGSVTWQKAGKKGVEPGWLRTDLNVTIPDVTCPFSAGLPSIPGVVGGKLYSFVFGTGVYVVPNLNGDAIVTGNALILVQNNSNCPKLVIQTNASVIVYAAGSMRFGDTDNQTLRAVNFSLLGLKTCKLLDMDDGFMGAVYAPYASTTISGNKQIYGSVAADSIRMAGGSDLHFDEALKDPARGGQFIITSWLEL